MRKLLGRIFGDRLIVTGTLIVLQVLAVVFGLTHLIERYPWLTTAMTVLSLIIVIWLVGKHDNPTYKIAWIIVIMAIPLLGGIFYLFFGNTPLNSAKRRNPFQPRNPDFEAYGLHSALPRLENFFQGRITVARYIERQTHMPVFDRTQSRYFTLGDDMFISMKEELQKAQRFIFLEYFIIQEGVMWNTILDILTEKVQAGVDVRLIYDDLGCISKIPTHYDKYLNGLGIQTIRFNRMKPQLTTYLNYRNHEKIMVIDGNVGFMGGINLADEYINHIDRFGHWKDTGFLLRGQGVASMTMIFLQMWEYASGTKMPAFGSYMPTEDYASDGYVQSFADSPLDDINTGETAYLQAILNAKEYVYITTPYLALDNEMITALSIAAQSGIDVRVCTPAIPDKKLVFIITRSYYQQLHKAGVKIFEYTPGFLHAKSLISDDDIAIVGTMNMDFRSFYLHFECATCFYRSSLVYAVKQDIEEIMAQSREIDDEWLKNIPIFYRITASIIRMFAPML